MPLNNSTAMHPADHMSMAVSYLWRRHKKNPEVGKKKWEPEQTNSTALCKEKNNPLVLDHQASRRA